MDLREKKTRRNIRSAFLQLRQTKALEKITIKELAELAEISKATFHLHYKDIFDLSENLQEEVIQSILGSIAHPEYYLTDHKAFMEELICAFHKEKEQIMVLFSGIHNTTLPLRLEQELRKFIKPQRPDMDHEAEMLFTYMIYGGYHVYQKHYNEYRPEEIIAFVCKIFDAVEGKK